MKIMVSQGSLSKEQAAEISGKILDPVRRVVRAAVHNQFKYYSLESLDIISDVVELRLCRS